MENLDEDFDFEDELDKIPPPPKTISDKTGMYILGFSVLAVIGIYFFWKKNK